MTDGVVLARPRPGIGVLGTALSTSIKNQDIETLSAPKAKDHRPGDVRVNVARVWLS
jgi:hypothetical protein